MILNKKMKRRILAPVFAYRARLHAFMAARRAIGWGFASRIEAARQMRGGKFPPGQWHRWYQVNRKRQRQIAAYVPRSRRGYYAPLKREMVK